MPIVGFVGLAILGFAFWPSVVCYIFFTHNLTICAIPSIILYASMIPTAVKEMREYDASNREYVRKLAEKEAAEKEARDIADAKYQALRKTLYK